MPIYGIGTKLLADFVTSEKDLIRKINRKPTYDFLMDVLGAGKKDNVKPDKSINMDGLQEAIDDFFDFEVINQDEVKKQMESMANSNRTEKI